MLSYRADMLRGAVFTGEDVARFLEWVEQLALAGALGT
jgi:hypothetical protein